MTISMHHVHLKTPDPKATAQFYIDNFGATIKGTMGTNGIVLDLHGLQINVTDNIPTQKRKQNYGIEHLAVDTTDYAGTMATLRKNGVVVMEELGTPDGRTVGFVQCPDGAQMEIIEKR